MLNVRLQEVGEWRGNRRSSGQEGTSMGGCKIVHVFLFLICCIGGCAQNDNCTGYIEYLGDGDCDPINNNEECGYDQGKLHYLFTRKEYPYHSTYYATSWRSFYDIKCRCFRGYFLKWCTLAWSHGLRGIRENMPAMWWRYILQSCSDEICCLVYYPKAE